MKIALFVSCIISCINFFFLVSIFWLITNRDIKRHCRDCNRQKECAELKEETGEDICEKEYFDGLKNKLKNQNN